MTDCRTRILNYLIPALYPLCLYLIVFIYYKIDGADIAIILVPVFVGIMNIIYAIYCYRKDEITILRNGALLIKSLLIPVYAMLINGINIYFSICYDSDSEIINVIGQIIIYAAIIMCWFITFVGSIYGILYILYKKRHGYEIGKAWIFHILCFLIIIPDFFVSLYLAITEKYII